MTSQFLDFSIDPRKTGLRALGSVRNVLLNCLQETTLEAGPDLFGVVGGGE